MREEAITYRAHGKVNLYLDVLNRRYDGFTNIETIFQSVGLADDLTFTPGGDAVTLTCSHAGVPLDDTNLVARAAALLRPRASAPSGCAVHIEKRLPVAGGMAGGSADCAAALVAFNELWQCGLDDAGLIAAALELGSDIPFCLRGGTLAATGRGEIFHPLRPLPETWLVLLLPGIPISAGSLYNHPQLERSLETPVEGFTPAFLYAIEACERGALDRLVFNRMELPAFIDHPGLVHWKEQLLESGCTAAAMSGSGSTLFGVCAGREQAEAIAASGFECAALAVPTVQAGVQRLDPAP
ncbi:MAG: 4-(cytidine 5'-diphospho)-2-C-methyl-D-erythritol kinase [Candidatus Hydrogenedens sp.]|nr:4-(cytidine 5'-diphospho)-2-C-methyl-D-erythritol kinase [Candidatus Hydrogenedens sp.]